MTQLPRYWIGTSWKMNKTLAQARVFADGLKTADAARDPRIQRFVIPPFTAVREVKAMLEGSSVKVGAQNMHWADEGAWTGEVSPLMLKDCNLDIVELGHSERREHFGETDETVGFKTEAAVRHGLVPLICIGETLAEREAGRAAEVLERQVRLALGKLAGSQKAATILLAAVAEDVLGRRVPCLYGGSVNPENCGELITCPDIDGLFIGRSAWNVEGYLDILAKCAAQI
jgi:triosephosphate isomerase